jgi:DNA-directed RNA polymerase beta subunit
MNDAEDISTKFSKWSRLLGYLQPPELEISKEDRVFLDLIYDIGFSKNLIEIFDNWMRDILPGQIMAREIVFPDGSTARYTNVVFKKQYSSERKANITPRLCREAGFTYKVSIYVDIEHIPNPNKVSRLSTNKEVKPNQIEKDVYYDELPIILGSKYCYLNGMTPEEKIAAGEDPNDPLGYYIIKGGEKTILNQEKLRTSIFLTVLDTKGKIETRMTCITPNGTSLVTMNVGKNLQQLKVKLAHMKGKKRIPLFVLFYYLMKHLNPNSGHETLLQDSMNYILQFVPEDEKLKVYFGLQSSLAKYNSYLKADGFAQLFKRKRPKDFGAEDTVETINTKVMNDIFNDLFPQVHSESEKINLLGMMTAQTLRVILGFRRLDDRDHWGNKRIETGARSLEQLVNALIEKVHNITQAGATASVSNTSINVRSLLKSNIIGEDIVTAFGANSWGVRTYEIKTQQIKKKYSSYKKENITDSLKRETPMAVISQNGRINTPSNRKSKQQSVRMVQTSQLGAVCLGETPEGEGCGMVKNTALTTYISSERSTDSIVELLELPENKILTNDFKDNDFNIPLMINGIIYKWVSPLLEERLRIGRRTRQLPKDCCIRYNSLDNILEYFCDNSRPTRPLLIVDNDGNLVMDIKNLWNESLDVMFSEGAIEFIDIREQDDIMLATKPDKVRNRVSELNESYDKQLEATRIRHENNISDDVFHNLATHYKVLNSYDKIAYINVALAYISDKQNMFNFIDILINSLATSTEFQSFKNDAEIDDILEVLENIKQTQISNNSINETINKFIEILNDILVPFTEIETNEEILINKYKFLTSLDDVLSLLDNFEDYQAFNADANLKEIEKIKDYYIIMAFSKEITNIINGFENLLSLYINESDKTIINNFKYVSNLTQLDDLYQTLNTLFLNFEIIENEVVSIEKYIKLSKARLYTHSEVNPIAMFGPACGLIPKSDSNQGPRTTYQASMCKQALGAYHFNQHLRFDSSYKVLTHACRATFETIVNEPAGLNVMPTGQQVIVAFLATGRNMEDAIEVNEDFLNAGNFEITKYTTHKAVMKMHSRNKDLELFVKPKANKREQEGRYAAIGEDGLPKLGAYIRQNDCILGRVKINSNKKIDNTSLYAGVGESGYVDRILISYGVDRSTIVRIKIRQRRKPQAGDKFASRFSQKGTFSIVTPSSKMIRVVGGPNHGLVPDFIVSAFSQPSRMTLGMIKEMLCTKAALYVNERIDATSFRNLDIERYKDILEANGMDRNGGERMCHANGKMIKSLVFCCPCYYQALRHHVLDKVQMRGRGAVNSLTHQPISGRKHEGASRQGEMERDAMISHGASAILLERLMKVCDQYRTTYCSNCGNPAVHDVYMKTTSCSVCDRSVASFGTITFPYVFKLINQYLAAFGINVVLKTVREIADGSNILQKYLLI